MHRSDSSAAHFFGHRRLCKGNAILSYIKLLKFQLAHNYYNILNINSLSSAKLLKIRLFGMFQCSRHAESIRNAHGPFFDDGTLIKYIFSELVRVSHPPVDREKLL